MEKVVLQAEKRDVTGKQVGALRRSGKLPAVIYGRHVEPIAIMLDAHSASLALAKLSSSSLVTIAVGGQEFPTLVREKQRNYIKGTITHVDFLAVDLNEKIRASIRVHFVGVSGAVKDYNAVLVHGLESIEVECLPTDLPEGINVDISSMQQVGEGIHVSDISLPDNIRILTDVDEMVVVATAPKVEEVVEAAAAAAPVAGAEGAQPELSVERGKKEEEGEE